MLRRARGRERGDGEGRQRSHAASARLRRSPLRTTLTSPLTLTALGRGSSGSGSVRSMLSPDTTRAARSQLSTVNFCRRPGWWTLLEERAVTLGKNEGSTGRWRFPAKFDRMCPEIVNLERVLTLRKSWILWTRSPFFVSLVPFRWVLLSKTHLQGPCQQ